MKLRYYLRGLGIGILVTAVILTIVLRGWNTMTDAEVVERARELGMEDKYEAGTLAQMNSDQTAAAADKTADKADGAETGTDKEKADSTVAAADKTEAADSDGKTADKTEGAETGTDKEKTGSTVAAADKTEAADSDGKTADKADAAEAGTDKEKADSAEAAADKTEAADSDGKTADKAEGAEAGTDKEKADSTVAAVEFVVNSGEGSDTIAAHLAKAGIVKDGAAFDAFLCSKGYDRKLRAGNHTIPANATDEQIAQALMQMPQ